MRRHAGLIGVGLLALAACTTSACVAGEADPANTSADPSSGPVALMPGEPLTDDEAAAFGAVAALDSAAACVGTLIDTGVPTGPAYLLTAGRCVGGLGQPPQSTALMLEWSGTADFLRTAAVQGRGIPVEVVELTYATMRNADMGIVRLGSTLADVEALGIASLPIAVEQPTSGEAVASIGIPVLGLQPDAQVLRRAECTLGDQRSLIESFWLWLGVFAADCGGVAAGGSGSPLLGVDENGIPVEVVAMVTAPPSDASPASDSCGLRHPCEVTRAGAVPVGETVSAQSVAGIGRCFDETTGSFSLGGECPLRVSDVWAERGGGVFQSATQPDADGRLAEASFVGESVGVLSAATIPFGNGEGCLDGDTYADAETHVLPRQGQPWEAVGVVVTPRAAR